MEIINGIKFHAIISFDFFSRLVFRLLVQRAELFRGRSGEGIPTKESWVDRARASWANSLWRLSRAIFTVSRNSSSQWLKGFLSLFRPQVHVNNFIFMLFRKQKRRQIVNSRANFFRFLRNSLRILSPLFAAYWFEFLIKKKSRDYFLEKRVRESVTDFCFIGNVKVTTSSGDSTDTLSHFLPLNIRCQDGEFLYMRGRRQRWGNEHHMYLCNFYVAIQ